MQGNGEEGVAPGISLARPHAGIARRWKIALVALSVVTVWAYARFDALLEFPSAPAAPPSMIIGSFHEPQVFIATPGEGNVHINVRAGPGAEFRVLRQFDRGVAVRGVARTLDSRGAYWIELAEGRGFIKESVLRPLDVGGVRE
jgi:hypothetical protein